MTGLKVVKHVGGVSVTEQNSRRGGVPAGLFGIRGRSLMTRVVMSSVSEMISRVKTTAMILFLRRNVDLFTSCSSRRLLLFELLPSVGPMREREWTIMICGGVAKIARRYKDR